ncbi:hypothetical protein CHS0354_038769 [Potamilus streckersoni]|uniref:Amino acid transporter n=1 Tax=Potamilus streckersoni TaxID=2493646 RepID=A0AAE0SSF8_9BIVA|nr:hypothetical protein CHS0354_038769 [Potamilus streckersoni]
MDSKNSKSICRKVKIAILNHLLIILIVTGVTIGIALGLGLRTDPAWKPVEKRKIFYLRFPGDLLMSMLKMLILPLIISSIITSLGGLNIRSSGKMGVRTIIYFLTTTFAAVVLGIILVLAIQPGHRGKSKNEIERAGKSTNTEPLDALFDLIRSCFPENIVSACFEKPTTVINIEKVPISTASPMTTNMGMNVSNITTHISITTATTVGTSSATMVGNVSNLTAFTTTIGTSTGAVMNYVEIESPKVKTADGMNVLGIIVFCIFFGVVLAKMGNDGKPLLDFFTSLYTATMILIRLVIWFSPVGIMFLIASKLVEMQDISAIFMQIGFYCLTVLVGLAIHGLIVLPMLYLIIVRKNPYRFMYNMLKALLTAWGTASSSATLPVTMECLEYNNKVDLRVAKLVAPVGSTVNMDGTALYEAVAAIFIAQVNNISFNIGQVITVSLTATAAAIGAAGIPEAGLVTMAIVLTSVNLPVEDITLIIAIDWLLDRFRTTVNVLGDAIGAGIVEKLSIDDLRKMDEIESNTDTDITDEASTISMKNDTIKTENGIYTVPIIPLGSTKL